MSINRQRLAELVEQCETQGFATENINVSLSDLYIQPQDPILDTSTPGYGDLSESLGCEELAKLQIFAEEQEPQEFIRDPNFDENLKKKNRTASYILIGLYSIGLVALARKISS